MRWPEDLAGWPHADASRRIACRPHRWHVQVMGDGPVCLLLHGAGGATQSWRRLMPLLAPHMTCIAPDLPGQGFTQLGTRWRCGLDAMAEDLAALLAQEGWAPDLIVGHSAGGAVALRLAEILPTAPKAIVGINAALGSFKGISGVLFPVMAKMLALNPLVPTLFSRFSGGEARVRDLLESTGSVVDAEMLQLYTRLVQDRAHVDGTLQMMAQWKLDSLLSRLPQIKVPTLFLVGEKDGTVPAGTSRDAAARMAHARVESLGELGHLVHEEACEAVAKAILTFAATHP
ncbi:alpha/beta fold hydrolase BchO [Anianabacter salinae]|uniref:alpha/beta fold hydrolase BchO n=1 Tax=Anianabacter salinae TaxID=2851023 RepID=UPI00225E0FAA|nr:alpha/beta fold hydrolase BchO [Anianabacter salinae]MBV0914129.1 alpha/beta fold hydrolase [Anianabacter salinae]